MLKLGVNIDHVATLREARYRGRGFGEPDPVEAARICEAAGVHGITAHLREDRRHIQDRDVWKLREVVKTRLNLEMAVVPEIIAIALKLKPDIVCIVPERRLEVTTEGGLDVVANEKAIADTRKKMNDAGIEVSLFIAPDEKQIAASARTGSQFVELHTGAFAEEFFLGAPASRRRVGMIGHDEHAGGPRKRIGALDFRRAAGACARIEGERRARIELREPARAAPRAASGGTEHRPQHHQPCGERRAGKGRQGNAALD
jgi:pyridoxine 5'-phosphate synthase